MAKPSVSLKKLLLGKSANQLAFFNILGPVILNGVNFFTVPIFTRLLGAENYGIRTAQNKYFAALQVRELFLNALKGIQGRYFENPIYDVDTSKAEEFDSAFPRKEKSADTPCQKRLEELLRMQRDFLGNQTIDPK